MKPKVKKFEKKFFEEWSTDYDKRRNKSFLAKSKETMEQLLEKYLENRENFFEIGLGTGESFELTNKKFDESYGMDISEGMVRRTNSKFKDMNLFVGDGCNLALKSNSFDFIICQDVLEHVPYQEKLIEEICRILKQDGIAIITTPNPLWAPALFVAEKLKMKVEEGEHKFVYLPKLVKKTIQKTNCQLVSSAPFMMLPIKSKLDRIVEPLAEKGFWSKFGFSQMCVIKKQT